jgi:hypothetical protein
MSMSQLTRGRGKGKGRQTCINKQKELVGGKIQWREIEIGTEEVMSRKIQFQGFKLLNAKQWVHIIITNELDLQPSCHNTLGVNNVDIAQRKINL